MKSSFINSFAVVILLVVVGLQSFSAKAQDKDKYKVIANFQCMCGWPHRIITIVNGTDTLHYGILYAWDDETQKQFFGDKRYEKRKRAAIEIGKLVAFNSTNLYAGKYVYKLHTQFNLKFPHTHADLPIIKRFDVKN